MQGLIRKVYCGASRIISSLGITTLENYMGVEAYTSNISRFEGEISCDIPLCKIDRTHLDSSKSGSSKLGSSKLDSSKLSLSKSENYTFAEQLSIIALNDTIEKSGVSLNNPSTLLIISTTKGNIDCAETDFERSLLWNLANQLSSYFNCANKPLLVSNACISGVAATIIGARLIEREEYDNVYVLGVDIASDFVVSGFNSFKSISPTICKPYDLSRDGLTLGEGCACLLLTSKEEFSPHKIIVSGGGLSDDANHISGPSRTGDGLAFAIEAAMQDARVEANDISFINAHGTGTVFNDEMESKAFEITALTKVPCNSLKPYIGHTLGASGVIEIILSIEQLKNNRVFGVKGYKDCGIPFMLNLSAQHRDYQLWHCLKTASGFGGTNAAIILSKESRVKPKYKRENKPKVVEVGSVEITKAEITKANVPFADYIRDMYKSIAEPNIKFFKMDDLSKLGYVASCKLMQGKTLEYSPNRLGIVLANSNSSLNTDLVHQKIMQQNLPEGTSPAIFVYTLANIVAAEIAIKHKFKGECMMFISEHKDMDYLKKYSSDLIEEDRCDAVLYGWCDLLDQEYNVELKLIKKE